MRCQTLPNAELNGIVITDWFWIVQRPRSQSRHERCGDGNAFSGIRIDVSRTPLNQYSKVFYRTNETLMNVVRSNCRALAPLVVRPAEN